MLLFALHMSIQRARGEEEEERGGPPPKQPRVGEGEGNNPPPREAVSFM